MSETRPDYEPRGCPTPGACSAADKIKRLTEALDAAQAVITLFRYNSPHYEEPEVTMAIDKAFTQRAPAADSDETRIIDEASMQAEIERLTARLRAEEIGHAETLQKLSDTQDALASARVLLRARKIR